MARYKADIPANAHSAKESMQDPTPLQTISEALLFHVLARLTSSAASNPSHGNSLKGVAPAASDKHRIALKGRLIDRLID